MSGRRERRRSEQYLRFFFYGFLFFHPLQLGFKPCADTLFDNPESGITVEKDRSNQGLEGICEDRIFAIPPESLLPATQPYKFFDT
jgi:hypothetical protein